MEHGQLTGAAAPHIRWIPLCASQALIEGGEAVPFDVVHGGLTSRAFAVRHQGEVHAYLNRCTHIAMEMDYQPNRFYDLTGRWLLCATHGAAYSPATGACVGGPCRGGLVKIALREEQGWVCWQASYLVKPLEF